MFGKNKKRETVQKANERLVRKVLQKDPGRRVFGFQCSPDILSSLKLLADQLHVPLFSLAEHALQLGAIQIAKANKSPEEREELRSHLTEVHVGMRTIEKISRYDEEASEILNIERERRFAIDNVARRIAWKYLSYGRKPELIEELIEYGARCMIAVEAGWPSPPNATPPGYISRPPRTAPMHNQNKAVDSQEEKS
jgi:hypothetical protein